MSSLYLPMSPIRDQRSMVDVSGPEGLHQTVAEVEEAWQGWADREGLIVRRRRNDFSTDLRASRKVVVAYISAGKWIADCPTCNGGVACWHENPRGACLDCGTIYQVDHPNEKDRLRAEELLGARDREPLRNWHRHHGETIEALERENELLNRERILAGAVSTSAIRDILGDAALEKLAKAGAV